MFKKRFLSCLLLAAVLFGCNKGDSDITGSVSTGNETAGDVSGAVEEGTEVEVISDAVNVFSGLSYFSKPGEDKLGELKAGEVVSYTGIIEKVGKHDYCKIITSSGETVWAMDYYIVADSVPGVIKTTEDITLFNKNNDNSLSNMDITPFRVIAVDTKLVDDTFSKFSWHNIKKGKYVVTSGKYILTDEVSLNKDDILFAKIITSYLNESDEGVKQELLGNVKSLTNICAEYQNYLSKIDMDDSMPKVPAVNTVNLKYESSFTLNGSSDSLLFGNDSASLDRLDNFRFDLLDYLIISNEYTENGLNIYILNSSNYNFTTIPAEFELSNGDVSFYLGVVGGLSVPSGETITLRLEGNVSEDINPDAQYELKMNFVNGKVRTGSSIDFAAGEV